MKIGIQAVGPRRLLCGRTDSAMGDWCARILVGAGEKGGGGRAKCDGLGWDGGGERWGFWCQDVWEMLGSGILRDFGGGGVEGKM